MQDEVGAKGDGGVDAFAAVYMVSLIVGTVVFWLSNQPV
jgi:hypothetical protein